MKKISALITLLSGILLSFIAYFRSDAGEVSDSVLWYFSQCLLYAGGIFSMATFHAELIRKLFNDRHHGKENGTGADAHL